MSCRKCGRRSRGRLCRDCEIEERAEERARVRTRLDEDEDDDDEGEDPVPLPDGGHTGAVTDAEIDHWVDLITDHATDPDLADYLGGVHEHTLIEEFDVDRAASTIRANLEDDDRVTTVLGFGDDGVQRSWAPVGSDIGVGEDVACPKSSVTHDGQPCVVCGHRYDREDNDECPQCANGSVEDYGDGVATDGGRVVHHGDAARGPVGIGDQTEPTCPNGSVECARPGTAPYFECLVGGDGGA